MDLINEYHEKKKTGFRFLESGLSYSLKIVIASGRPFLRGKRPPVRASKPWWKFRTALG